MAARFLLAAVFALVIGILFGGGVQVGTNSLRFLIQPEWLTPQIDAGLTALSGLFAAVVLAASMAITLKRTVGEISGLVVFFALLAAICLDPYYLAELGWTEPSRQQAMVRGLSLAIAAGGIALPVAQAEGDLTLYGLFAIAAIAGYALLPRFEYVPVLGGDMDLAAMSPLHLLVFGKGMLLLIVAAALTLALRRKWSKAR